VLTILALWLPVVAMFFGHLVVLVVIACKALEGSEPHERPAILRGVAEVARATFPRRRR